MTVSEAMNLVSIHYANVLIDTSIDAVSDDTEAEQSITKRPKRVATTSTPGNGPSDAGEPKPKRVCMG